MMHKAKRPIKNAYQGKQLHHSGQARKENPEHLSDGERARISDYLMLEGPLNAQKFPRLQQLVYLSLPFCNLGYVGIRTSPTCSTCASPCGTWTSAATTSTRTPCRSC